MYLSVLCDLLHGFLSLNLGLLKLWLHLNPFFQLSIRILNHGTPQRHSCFINMYLKDLVEESVQFIFARLMASGSQCSQQCTKGESPKILGSR